MLIFTTKMSDGGQIVMPAKIRKEQNIKAKDNLLVVSGGDMVIVKKVEDSKDMISFSDAIKKLFSL